MYAVVDVYGSATAVSLCNLSDRVVDCSSQSVTHSQTNNVLTPTDQPLSFVIACEADDTASAAEVSFITD